MCIELIRALGLTKVKSGWSVHLVSAIGEISVNLQSVNLLSTIESAYTYCVVILQYMENRSAILSCSPIYEC